MEGVILPLTVMGLRCWGKEWKIFLSCLLFLILTLRFLYSVFLLALGSFSNTMYPFSHASRGGIVWFKIVVNGEAVMFGWSWIKCR